MGESDIIYDSPSETVPEHFFCSNAGYFYKYDEVKHISGSVYKKVFVKYQFQPPLPFLAELKKTNLFLAYVIVGQWYIRKAGKINLSKNLGFILIQVDTWRKKVQTNVLKDNKSYDL